MPIPPPPPPPPPVSSTLSTFPTSSSPTNSATPSSQFVFNRVRPPPPPGPSTGIVAKSPFKTNSLASPPPGSISSLGVRTVPPPAQNSSHTSTSHVSISIPPPPSHVAPSVSPTLSPTSNASTSPYKSSFAVPPAPSPPSSSTLPPGVPPPPPGPAPVPPVKPQRTTSLAISKSSVSNSTPQNFSPPGRAPLSPSSQAPSPTSSNDRLQYENASNNPEERYIQDRESRTEADIMLEKRFYVIQEMITTEDTYILKLESLIKHVIMPLKETRILDQEDFEAQFSPIIHIYEIHKKFSFSDTSSRNLTFVNLIDELMQNLDVYSNYLAYFDPNQTRRGYLITYNKRFAEFLDQLSKSPPKYYDNLESLMIQPVQRIPRYRLLIQELLKYTPPDHPDYTVASDALEKVMKLAKYYNEAVRKRENKTKLMNIMMSLDASNRVDLLESSDNRWVLKEGFILRQCRRKHKEFNFWLLSDQLLYGERNPLGGFSLNRQIPFDRCAIRDPFIKKKLADGTPDAPGIEASPSDTSLTSDNDELDLIFESTIKSFRLRFPNKQEKAQWKYALTKALDNYRKSKVGQSQGDLDGDHKIDLDGIGTSSFQVDDIVIGEEDIGLAPLWKPDSESPNCDLCNAQFSLISRRHHCRNCGKLVCQQCSSRRYILAHVDKKPVRVCDPCYSTLSGSDSTNTTNVSSASSDLQVDVNGTGSEGEDKLTGFSTPSTPSPAPSTRKLGVFRGIATFLGSAQTTRSSQVTPPGSSLTASTNPSSEIDSI